MPPDRQPTAATPRILVVDDDALVRELVRRHLEDAGHAVIEASGGRAALELLREGTAVQAVVTDLQMADGSGGWLLAQLGYEFPGLLPRTVVITADADGARAAHIATRWRCPVLAKPFSGASLLRALADRLDSVA